MPQLDLVGGSPFTTEKKQGKPRALGLQHGCRLHALPIVWTFQSLVEVTKSGKILRWEVFLTMLFGGSLGVMGTSMCHLFHLVPHCLVK